MGQQCCGGEIITANQIITATEDPKQFAILKGKTYSAKDIWTIVRIQAGVRMFLAKMKTQKLRTSNYTSNTLAESTKIFTGEKNYDNENVKVST